MLSIIHKIRRKTMETMTIAPDWLQLSLNYGYIRIRLMGSDTSVFKAVFVDKELDVFSYVGDIKPKLIVDAGAYIGLSPLYYAYQYPDAQIISLEPEKNNYRLLIQNTKKFPNIKTHRKALWHEETSISLVNPGKSHWSFQVTDQDTKNVSESIKTMTIPQIINQSDHDLIDILKIDIEGAEKKLLSHDTKWLESVRVIFIELHDRFLPGCKEALEKACSKDKWIYHHQGEKVILINKQLS